MFHFHAPIKSHRSGYKKQFSSFYINITKYYVNAGDITLL